MIGSGNDRRWSSLRLEVRHQVVRIVRIPVADRRPAISSPPALFDGVGAEGRAGVVLDCNLLAPLCKSLVDALKPSCLIRARFVGPARRNRENAVRRRVNASFHQQTSENCEEKARLVEYSKSERQEAPQSWSSSSKTRGFRLAHRSPTQRAARPSGCV
jgi:hypothetical protein